MARRIVLVLSIVALAGLWLAVPQASAQGGGGCQLSGTANFKQPLTNNTADFQYSFTGTLSNCMSNENAPSDGVVSAGVPLKVGAQKFRESVPKGNGSCGSGTTAGVSIVKWSNGAYTIFSYSTNSAGPGVILQGQVVPQVRLPAINPKPGQLKSIVIKSTLYTGASGQSGGVLGLLTFTPPDA